MQAGGLRSQAPSPAAYLESDLKKSIAEAYELTAPPKIQRFPIVDTLRK